MSGGRSLSQPSCPVFRKVKNQRLAAVGYLWTFAALRLSTGAISALPAVVAAMRAAVAALLNARGRPSLALCCLTS